MKREFAGATIFYVEMLIPFTYDGVVFRQGGVIVCFGNGTRTAVTRDHFRRWFK
jgi:hypothetical protein